jgi:L-fucose mutarotase
MLKGIHPILTADVLHVIARMGHGDDLAIVDANHPAESISRSTTSGALIRCPGLAVDRQLEAIMTLFPIDDFTDDPLRFMEVVGDATALPEAVRDMQDAARRSGFKGDFARLERFAFYAAARSAFAIIQCGDPRFYGNVLIRKGALEGTKPVG